MPTNANANVQCERTLRTEPPCGQTNTSENITFPQLPSQGQNYNRGRANGNRDTTMYIHSTNRDAILQTALCETVTFHGLIISLQNIRRERQQIDYCENVERGLHLIVSESYIENMNVWITTIVGIFTNTQSWQ